MKRIWTKEEEELLIKVYPIKTIEELCEIFPDKTEKQINKKAKNLKLRKNKLFIKEYRIKKSLEARKDLWSDEELKILQKHYPNGGVYEVQKFLPHKSYDSIRRKANKLGITIDENSSQWDLINHEHLEDNPFVWKFTFRKKVVR
ncbi:hypothetical protein [Bacillus smithii]|uniref:hypothetical protein n=1 Tax=Bacillus smithii TaxID=1479 RepID=UPI002E1C110E|nr:hypothetical protein [Bacillus smithii]MED4928850.1 hypothetical protein [Bacillus smithii]